MAWLRRMYARLLFVVVGIFGPVLVRFTPVRLCLTRRIRELRLGIIWRCGYTLAA